MLGRLDVGSRSLSLSLSLAYDTARGWSRECRWSALPPTPPDVRVEPACEDVPYWLWVFVTGRFGGGDCCERWSDSLGFLNARGPVGGGRAAPFPTVEEWLVFVSRNAARGDREVLLLSGTLTCLEDATKASCVLSSSIESEVMIVCDSRSPASSFWTTLRRPRTSSFSFPVSLSFRISYSSSFSSCSARDFCTSALMTVDDPGFDSFTEARRWGPKMDRMGGGRVTTSVIDGEPWSET